MNDGLKLELSGGLGEVDVLGTIIRCFCPADTEWMTGGVDEATGV